MGSRLSSLTQDQPSLVARSIELSIRGYDLRACAVRAKRTLNKRDGVRASACYAREKADVAAPAGMLVADDERMG